MLKVLGGFGVEGLRVGLFGQTPKQSGDSACLATYPHLGESLADWQRRDNWEAYYPDWELSTHEPEP